jgi:hypothetical protein
LLLAVRTLHGGLDAGARPSTDGRRKLIERHFRGVPTVNAQDGIARPDTGFAGRPAFEEIPHDNGIASPSLDADADDADRSVCSRFGRLIGGLAGIDERGVAVGQTLTHALNTGVRQVLLPLHAARGRCGSTVNSTARPVRQHSGSPLSSSTVESHLESTRDARVTSNPHRISRRLAPSDALRRAEVQQHPNARTERLQAYVTSRLHSGRDRAEPAPRTRARVLRELEAVRVLDPRRGARDFRR